MYMSPRHGYTCDILWLGRRHILIEHPTCASWPTDTSALTLIQSALDQTRGSADSFGSTREAADACGCRLDGYDSVGFAFPLEESDGS